jgi:hypothetical protein
MGMPVQSSMLLESIDDKQSAEAQRKVLSTTRGEGCRTCFTLTRQPPRNPGGRMEQRDIDISFPENGKQATAG